MLYIDYFMIPTFEFLCFTHSVKKTQWGEKMHSDCLDRLDEGAQHLGSSIRFSLKSVLFVAGRSVGAPPAYPASAPDETRINVRLGAPLLHQSDHATFILQNPNAPFLLKIRPSQMKIASSES